MPWPKKPSLSPRKCWLRNRSKVGRRLSMKSCATDTTTVSPSVIWKTSTRSVSIRASLSSSLRRRRSPMPSTTNCVRLLSKSFAISVSSVSAMCSMLSTPSPRTIASSRSMRVCRAPLRWRQRLRAIPWHLWQPNSVWDMVFLNSTTALPRPPLLSLNRHSTMWSARFLVGTCLSSVA